jgi:hypothetical protein
MWLTEFFIWKKWKGIWTGLANAPILPTRQPLDQGLHARERHHRPRREGAGDLSSEVLFDESLSAM